MFFRAVLQRWREQPSGGDDVGSTPVVGHKRREARARRGELALAKSHHRVDVAGQPTVRGDDVAGAREQLEDGDGLAAAFSAWYASERTLSIHSIFTTRREAFYWLTVLFTFVFEWPW